MPPPPSGDTGQEHGDGDSDDDPVEFRPPLPPEDRIWRHPSEMAADAARPSPPVARDLAPTSARRAPTGRNALALVAASALIGATLSVGVIAALGGFETQTRVVERQVAVQPVTSLADEGARAIADRTSPSVAALHVLRGDERNEGTAVVFRSDGYLLTTASLVVDADTVYASLGGRPTVAAEIVGTDAATDLAVLHIDAVGLEPAVLGSAHAVQVGTDALVMGHAPDGASTGTIDWTMVSAIDHRLRTPDGTVLHGMMILDDFSHGSDGSPLLDDTGAVIGITSGMPVADDERTRSVAMPIDLLVHAADQILEHGHVRHVWLGVEGIDLAADDASTMGLAGGAAVQQVVDGSPAAEAGIEAGDVVVGVDGEPVASMSQLIAELRGREPGDEVRLQVRRGEESMERTASLAEKTG